MGIPIGQTTTASLSAATPKDVVCEGCQTHYVYLAKRSAIGQGTSLLFLDNDGAGDRATRRAEENLKKELENAVDPVPCPSCGHYQESMVRVLKGQYCSWMRGFTFFFIVVAVISTLLFLLGLDPNTHYSTTMRHSITAAMVVSVSGWLVFSIGRRKLVAGYDPNATSLESRMAIATREAILKSKFDEILAKTAGH